jgi:hypothetical protein
MMKLRSLLLCLGLATLLASTSVTAFAAQKFLMSIEGTKQGKVKGESTVRGHEGWTEGGKVTIGDLEMSEANHATLLKTLTTGRRVHEPIKIVREVDKASPIIWTALCSNETFKTATIDIVDEPASSKAEPKVIHRLVITGGTYSVKADGPGKQMIIFVGGDVEYK